MPARIEIESGPQAGTSHWIDDEVVRIGQEAPCEFRVLGAGIPAHALTLEYDKGRYRVHNRAPGPILLAGRELPGGGAAIWAPGSDLMLGRDVILRLLVEGHPRPSPAPVQVSADEESAVMADALPPAGDAAPAAPAPGGSGKLLQWAVILGCVVGGAAMLVLGPRDQQGAGTSGSAPAPKLADLLAGLDEANPAYAAEFRAVIDAIQDAERCMLRDDAATAALRYQWARDRILAARDRATGASADPFFDDLLAYLRVRLEALAPVLDPDAAPGPT